MQTLISMSTAGVITAAAEHVVAQGHFNLVAGAAVFCMAWLVAAAVWHALDRGDVPHREAA